MKDNISCLYFILFYSCNKFKGVYIGITNNLRNRISQHKSESRNENNKLPVYHAMRKYEYKVVKVAEIYDRELLNEMETITIQYARDLGIKCFNITKGGEGTVGVGCVPVNMFSMDGILLNTFDSIVEASSFVNGTTSSITACAKGKTSKSAYGYIWRYVGDAFDKYNIDNARSNEVKRVIQYDFNGNIISVFESNKDVERKLGISNSHVSACCLGKVGSSFGYVWRYEGDPFNKFEVIRDSCRAVCKYTYEGELLNTYYSLKQAGEDNNTPTQNIYHCCKGNRISCGGFIWRYEGDPFELYPTDKKKKIRKVMMLSLSGEVLSIFSNGKEAERITGIPQSSISACCLGKVKTAGGYKWKYIEN